MIKKTLFAITFFCSICQLHAGAPRPNPTISLNANLRVSDMPSVPLTVNVNASPSTLIASLGFVECYTAIQLWKKGTELIANQDIDEVIRLSKQTEGYELIKKSYALFFIGSLSILNKQIANLATK